VVVRGDFGPDPVTQESGEKAGSGGLGRGGGGGGLGGWEGEVAATPLHLEGLLPCLLGPEGQNA